MSSEPILLNNGQLRAQILRRGAALQSLYLAGHAPSLVLGHPDPAAYADNPGYLGAIVGRVANRIAEGQATINGHPLQFDRNEKGRHTLHGGSAGSSTRLWQISHQSADEVTLTDTLPDGHMGFPGALIVQVSYRLDGPSLALDITARSDAATLCNFAPHLYFNLSCAPVIDDHRLQIDAPRYLPSEQGLPLGAPAFVASTRFDLRQPRPIPAALDHNYCLADAPRALQEVATLTAGPRRLRLATTEPGLQAYDGAKLNIPRGLDGAAYGPHAGLALEPQRWPNAANTHWRAQTDLAPGETYHSQTRLTFT